MVDTHPTLQALKDRVLAASADGSALCISGSGSKDFYGQALHGELLDARPWAGISSYEPSELVVTARAGTRLAELEAVLAERGQALAFEPPHFGPGATVGGMVAAGLSGPARASMGALRDYVLGASLINGRGELLTFGGQVMKNVAGYDVSRLLVGSLGALGLITEVSLKVLPIAPAEATLVCAGVSQSTALALLNRWGGQPLPLNASCWLFDTTAGSEQDLLFVRLRGALAAVQAACPQLAADVQAAGGSATQVDQPQAGSYWAACREQSQPFSRPRHLICACGGSQCGKPRRCWTCPTRCSSNGTGPCAGSGPRPALRRACALWPWPPGAMPRCFAPARPMARQTGR